MTKDRHIFSVVFGKWGEWNTVCTIRQSGKTTLDRHVIEEKYTGGDLMAFAKKVTRQHTSKNRLSVAGSHYYKAKYNG